MDKVKKDKANKNEYFECLKLTRMIEATILKHKHLTPTTKKGKLE